MRPSGVCLTMFSRASSCSNRAARKHSLITLPKVTAFTLLPRGASTTASARVIWLRAALLTEYASRSGCTRCDAIDDRLMIDPTGPSSCASCLAWAIIRLAIV